VISLDTNILAAALNASSRHFPVAQKFVQSLDESDDIVISEFVLAELYVVLRSPLASPRPLSATKAADTCRAFRQHPRWRLVGFPPHSVDVHEELWKIVARPAIARRRIYDIRTALCLLQQGVTEFATANLKDFEGLGFGRVWNPLGGKG
jgi:predicted nucleic acid-binding protein